MSGYPVLMHTALDATDCRGLAEFYRRLLGLPRHLAAQRENVGKLKDALAEHSIEGFVAHQAIQPTQQWQDVIESGLRSCDALAVWLSAGIKESPWCDQEVGFAVCRGILVVPIRKIDDACHLRHVGRRFHNIQPVAVEEECVFPEQTA